MAGTVSAEELKKRFPVGSKVRIAVPIPDQEPRVGWSNARDRSRCWMRNNWGDGKEFEVLFVGYDTLRLNSIAHGATLNYNYLVEWLEPVLVVVRETTSSRPTIVIRETTFEAKPAQVEVVESTPEPAKQSEPEPALSIGTAVGLAALATFGLTAAKRLKEHFLETKTAPAIHEVGKFTK